MIEAVQVVDRMRDVAVEQAAVRFGYTPLQARVIAGRIGGVAPESVRNMVSPTLSQLSSPAQLPDIDVAAEAVAKAVISRQPILIISDFDCDGASGHCVVKIALTRHFGVPSSAVHSYIGHRMRDGYGVSGTLTDRIISGAPRPSLAITVDQGTSDQDRIAALRAAGIETVVTDHHGVPEVGPPLDALACVNPARRDSLFGDPFVAGVHVAWLLCCAVRQRLVEVGYLPKDAPKLGSLLDIVALGTIADCVDLGRSANNRLVLQKGLELMNRPDGRPVWRALQAATRSKGQIDSSMLGFSFGPVINARGRLDCALGSVDFLLCENEAEALRLAHMLVAHNLERRVVQKGMLERAIGWAERQVGEGRAAITIFDPQGHAGVHGICASRLVELTGRPVAYFSPRLSPSLLTGSLRSVPGFDVRAALERISRELGALVKSWGGHFGAGGTVIDPRALERFAELWSNLSQDALSSSERGPRLLTDGALGVAPRLATYRELSALEPFGRQWERPSFRAVSVVRQSQFVGDGSHVKLRLDMDGEPVEAIWFNVPRTSRELLDRGSNLRVAFEMDENTFRDSTTLQLLIRHAEPV